jgi:hypothetical protein
MLKNLYFDTSRTVFTRAQAIVWVSSGLSEIDLFEKSAGKLLSEIIDTSPEQKTLIINFKGIIRLVDHCLDDVFSSLEGNKKRLIITNGNQLYDQFTRFKKGKAVDIREDSANNIIILGNQEPINYEDLSEERKVHINDYINQTLKSTFKKFNDFKRLCSTPFLANGEFDSKVIIESPKDFMWISFYLSNKLSSIIESEKLSHVVLVSASLRGATFTSILGILNDLEYHTIDHIGPIHKVYDFNSLNSEHRGKNHIYIGDFVFGGTEIKLTKVYTSFNGATLNHALVLGSLFNSEVFTDFKLHELNTLNKISSEAKFKLFD